MHNEIRQQIHDNLTENNTDYLLEIWQNGDPEEWDEITFEVVGEILRERLVDLPPRSAKAGVKELLKQVECHLDADEWDQAVKLCQQIIKIDPQAALAHHYLGVIYDESDQTERAFASLQKAVELDPGLKEARELLETVEQDLGEEFEDSEAKQLLERACEYVDAGEAEKALKECDLAKKALPNIAIAWNYLGLIYQGSEKLDLAIEAYLKAIQLNPRFYPARTNLANARVAWEAEQYRLIAAQKELPVDESINPDMDIDQVPEYECNDSLAPQWLYMSEPAYLLRGWPGHRNRQGRIGLDPLDTDFEQAHIEGTIIRKLITLKLRTRNPFYLLLMSFVGLICCLPLLGILALIQGDWYPGLGLTSSYPLIPLGVTLWINLLASLLSLKPKAAEENGNTFY
jgi:tetratricopeptide (TPR) repeat protein